MEQFRISPVVPDPADHVRLESYSLYLPRTGILHQEQQEFACCIDGRLPGNIQVVVKNDFVGVVADTEWNAIQAVRVF